METGVQFLLVAIVQDQDADPALRALTRAGLRATRISSMGSFLDRGNVTLLIGLGEGDAQRALDLLAENCHRRTTFINAAPPLANPAAPGLITPLEVEIGGATVMSLAVEQFAVLGAASPAPAADMPGSSSATSRTKLVVAIVSGEQNLTVLNALRRDGHPVTRISTTGGFLRKGNATLLIGVDQATVPGVLKSIQSAFAAPATGKNQEQAGATVFVLAVEQQLRL